MYFDVFLMEPFFLHNQKAFKLKQKAFSSFLKGSQLSKIVLDFRVRL